MPACPHIFIFQCAVHFSPTALVHPAVFQNHLNPVSTSVRALLQYLLYCTCSRNLLVSSPLTAVSMTWVIRNANTTNVMMTCRKKKQTNTRKKNLQLKASHWVYGLCSTNSPKPNDDTFICTDFKPRNQANTFYKLKPAKTLCSCD